MFMTHRTILLALALTGAICIVHAISLKDLNKEEQKTLKQMFNKLQGKTVRSFGALDEKEFGYRGIGVEIVSHDGKITKIPFKLNSKLIRVGLDTMSSSLKTVSPMEISLDPNYSSSNLQKSEVQGVPGAFILSNVLKEEECEFLMTLTEEMGYEKEKISIKDKNGNEISKSSSKKNQSKITLEQRNNDRIMATLKPEQIEILSIRLSPHLPKEIEMNGHTWVLHNGKEGLNPRFRFYRYEPNAEFSAHFDIPFSKGESIQSLFTILFYLNDGFEGGETTFYPGVSEASPDVAVAVNPIKGAALLFYHQGDHSPLHEGSPHFSKGKYKYSVRSDVVYRRL